MSRRRRRGWAVWIGPLACVAAALAALLWVGGASSGAASSDEDDEDAGVVEEVGLAEAASEAASDVLALLEGGGAAESSGAAFLEDLELLAAEEVASDGDGAVAVSWTEEDDLVAAAETVLEAYAAQDGVSLATSGYLDLMGNAWGAVVRGGTSWVDIVLVTTEDDEESTVSIVRLSPEGYEEEFG